MSSQLEAICDIAKRAGEEIVRVYEDKEAFAEVETKADNSPLTLADRRSHDIIVAQLAQQFPSIPVLSEEGAAIDYEIRKQWSQYWLIDPLDGTKEFINRNGEFTVNIALVEKQTPVLGVVHAPVLGRTYSGATGSGATLQEANGAFRQLHVNEKPSHRIGVRSKSHASPEEEQILERYGVVDCVSVGSSLKFCLVADGQADVYYRHGPTMEWDVAAGQAVVQAAGGAVYDGTGPAPFLLTKPNLLNGSFLCLGCKYVSG